MTKENKPSRFEARLLRPAASDKDDSWAFVVLPKEVSAVLPRRGRTTVDAAVNGHAFRATLEPDGQRSHWLRLSRELLEASGAHAGDVATFDVAPVEHEPEPEIPSDLQQALQASSEALAGWHATTTIARLDWIHWITSAKQAKTRAQRISNACSMLASGKLRVCCFDPSGFYSKAFSAPKAAD